MTYYTVESDTIEGIGTLYWADDDMVSFQDDLTHREGEPYDGWEPEIRLSFGFKQPRFFRGYRSFTPRKTKKLKDFKYGVADLSSVDSLMVLSLRARDVLDPLIGENVEYLEVRGPVDNIVGVHVLKHLKAFEIRDNGTKNLPAYGHLFTTLRASPFIVSEDFKRAVETHQLTNCLFKELKIHR